jgi:spore coat polysaccharide biosynthesis predicted glycosyltransferase SpsG/CMP-N-acetylneuraminic acid synthetase
MNASNIKVVIPALKKTVAFQDDLVKKLSGITLIQRAINKAFKLGVENKYIYLITDSDEIRVLGERNKINTYWDSDLTWEEKNNTVQIWTYLQNIADEVEYMLFLSPYAPLLSVKTINSALNDLIKSNKFILKPVIEVKRHLYDGNKQSNFETLFGDKKETHKIESKSFSLVKKGYFLNEFQDQTSIFEWPIDSDIFEIKSYQDWWVCEKLIDRKRIIFRVIGNKIVGMGHIYRALSLAHEITNHEILFVCDKKSDIAVNKLSECNYWFEVYDSSIIVENIANLNPDLVITDILSSKEEDILPLKKLGIKTLNFEDLGEGGRISDLTINELYDIPLYNSKNTLWGHKFFFVRDEFNDASPHIFKSNIKKIMLSFGGTDQHNLSYKVYKVLDRICAKRKIDIHIVTGSGYKEHQILENEIKGTSRIYLTQATGVISNIMEDCQLAIVSNGRTVYELAHMNIPSIVISQHEREEKHSFACEQNGFLNIGLFNEDSYKELIEKNFLRLINDEDFRHQLFLKTMKYSFDSNKQKVLDSIDQLLN